MRRSPLIEIGRKLTEEVPKYYFNKYWSLSISIIWQQVGEGLWQGGPCKNHCNPSIK